MPDEVVGEAVLLIRPELDERGLRQVSERGAALLNDSLLKGVKKGTTEVINLFKKAVLAEAAFLTAVSVAGIKAASSLETTKVALQGLSNTLGTTADDALAKISDFAARTPFLMQSTIDSVIKLSSAFHLTLDPALDVLTVIGNAAAAAGKGADEIDRVTTALTQMGSKGRLTAQDLNQVSEALPNIAQAAVFEEIARRMGKTRQEAKDLADQGLIPAGVAIESILTVANQVPGALGAMERQSHTLSGEISTLKDNLTILLGNAFLPVIKAIEEQLSPLLNANAEDLKKLGQSIGEKLVPAFKELIPLVIDLAKRFIDFNKDLVEALPSIIDKLVKVGRVVGIVTLGFQALSDTFALEFSDANKKIDQFGKAIDHLNDPVNVATKSGGAFSGTLEDIRKNLGKLIATPEPVIPDFGGEALQKTFEQVNKTIESILSGSTELVTANRSLRGATRDLAGDQAALAALLKEGGEHELAQARRQLADATDDVAKAEERRLSALAALADLQQPASEEERAAATDAVARAEISLRDAIRARDEVQRKANETERTFVNLAGLSLDQIKSKLANVRATLAAQRATQRSNETAGKSQAEIDDQTLTAELNVRDAVRSLEEARKSLADTENKGRTETEAIKAARRQLEDAEKGVQRALEGQAEARTELHKIEAGDSQFAKDLAAARDAVTSSEEKLRDAKLASSLATAELNQKIKEANGLSGTENDLLKEKIRLLKEAGVLAPDALAVINASIAAIAERLKIVTSINGDLEIKPAFGTSVPAFAEGGLIKSPVIARLGERFKHELVLPLSDSSRVFDLLSANLPKYPGALGAAQQALSPSSPGRLTRRIHGSGGSSDVRKSNHELAVAIADEFERRGLAKPDVHIESPITISAQPQDTDAVARKVKRQVERTLLAALR